MLPILIGVKYVGGFFNSGEVLMKLGLDGKINNVTDGSGLKDESVNFVRFFKIGQK